MLIIIRRPLNKPCRHNAIRTVLARIGDAVHLQFIILVFSFEAVDANFDWPTDLYNT